MKLHDEFHYIIIFVINLVWSDMALWRITGPIKRWVSSRYRRLFFLFPSESQFFQWQSMVAVQVGPSRHHFYIVFILYIVELVFVLNITEIRFAGQIPKSFTSHLLVIIESSISITVTVAEHDVMFVNLFKIWLKYWHNVKSFRLCIWLILTYTYPSGIVILFLQDNFHTALEIYDDSNTINPAHAVTSLKQPPVSKGHLLLVWS